MEQKQKKITYLCICLLIKGLYLLFFYQSNFQNWRPIIHGSQSIFKPANSTQDQPHQILDLKIIMKEKLIDGTNYLKTTFSRQNLFRQKKPLPISYQEISEIISEISFLLLFTLLILTKISFHLDSDKTAIIGSNLSNLLFYYFLIWDIIYFTYLEIIIRYQYMILAIIFASSSISVFFFKGLSMIIEESKLLIFRLILFSFFMFYEICCNGHAGVFFTYSLLPFFQVLDNMKQQRKKCFNRYDWLLYFDNIYFIVLSNTSPAEYLLKGPNRHFYIIGIVFMVMGFVGMLLQEVYGAYFHIHCLRDFFVKQNESTLYQVVAKNEEDENQSQCSICYEMLSKTSLLENLTTSQDNIQIGYIVRTHCNHNFHYKCLIKWQEKRNVCPLDKKPLSVIPNPSYWC